MNHTNGSIVEEGITHEYFWRYQNRRCKAIKREALYIFKEIESGDASGPVLEIGAGTGHTLHYLAELLPPDTPIVGIDNDPQMIAYAGRLCGANANIKLELRDGRRELPYPDASFHLIIAEHCFHHMKEVDTTLKEIVRLLKPEGKFVFIDMAPERLLSRIFKFLYPLIRLAAIRWPIGEGAYLSLQNSFLKDELIRLFRTAGLKEIHQTFVRFNQRITLVKA
jgi:ubiquinone/menaquinone biosynthesis C-methylase UbiE